MDTIRFSAITSERCDSCSCVADYGFFIGSVPLHEMTGPRDESFLCTSCAQKQHDLAHLQEAIDAQDEPAEDHLWNRAISRWIDFEVLAG